MKIKILFFFFNQDLFEKFKENFNTNLHKFRECKVICFHSFQECKICNDIYRHQFFFEEDLSKVHMSKSHHYFFFMWLNITKYYLIL